jgi:ABC-type multidrug transport system ATPase subunit
VEENLAFFATIFGTTIRENYHLIQDIYSQIEPFKTRKAGKLSGGMKQKLALSCALIHKPKVLILDEPTTGVDAVSRKEFWDVLRRLKEQGITIMVSTPYMDEAGQCDRVALIQKGGIMDIDTPQAIVDKYEHYLVGITSSDMYRLLKDLATLDGVISVNRFGDSIHVAMEDPGLADNLRHELEGRQHNEVLIKPIKPNIEDCFMELMTRNHD